MDMFFGGDVTVLPSVDGILDGCIDGISSCPLSN